MKDRPYTYKVNKQVRVKYIGNVKNSTRTL